MRCPELKGLPMTILTRLARLIEAWRPGPDPATEGPGGRFVEAALERHKQEGMILAFRARLAAMAVFAITIPMTASLQSTFFYELPIVILAFIGWLQLRAARVGRSRLELLLIMADILIITAVSLLPNPFIDESLPAPVEFRTESFKFFFVILAFGTLAYSWRTVRFMGTMTVLTWAIAIWFISLTYVPNESMTASIVAAFPDQSLLQDLLDPNSFLPWIRFQEMVVFLVVAWILATTVQRFTKLVVHQAGLERERANLARYFSPNVVDDLSRNDVPLKDIRSQNVAVMFVDIVGFTPFAAERPAEQVIETLRDFHARMQAAVFRHGGTLDKFLGDGLMASFGTPTTKGTDARDALACALDMAQALEVWNGKRTADGEPPIRVGIGVHYGRVVLGDIGADQLEFALIGDTVNVASRVENLTRTLSVQIAVTEATILQARSEGDGDCDPCAEFICLGANAIRGQDRPIEIWGRPMTGRPAQA